MNVIEIKDLCMKVENFRLKHINMTVEAGTITGFVGENGAGKTTTLKAIMNINENYNGSIKVLGKEMRENEVSLKEQVAYISSDKVFLSETLTTLKHAKILSKIYPTWDENYFNELIKKYDIKDKRIANLSTGERMRLKIVLALARRPKVLILDEPTSGLDPIIRKELIGMLKEFVAIDNNACLISTHITSDLEGIVDKLYLIDNGEIIYELDSLNLDDARLIKLSEEEFNLIKKEDYIRHIKEKYQHLILSDVGFTNKYSFGILEKVKIEDLMYLIIKGDTNERS